MTALDFLGCWFLVGLFGILVRPKMIYQEENRNYRIALVIASSPCGIILNLVIHIFVGMKMWLEGTKRTINGKNPNEAEAP